jgi:hypothetical protein
MKTVYGCPALSFYYFTPVCWIRFKFVVSAKKAMSVVNFHFLLNNRRLASELQGNRVDDN